LFIYSDESNPPAPKEKKRAVVIDLISDKKLI